MSAGKMNFIRSFPILCGIFVLFEVRISNMVMLKNIPRILSPELLSVLARMGHGDEIILADGNFPSNSIAKAGPELVRADGHGCVNILKAVLELLPIDKYDSTPVNVMEPTHDDKIKGVKTPIWDEFEAAINLSEGRNVTIGQIERFAFYERAKTVFAVVATSEEALYGNIILRKGVL